MRILRRLEHEDKTQDVVVETYYLLPEQARQLYEILTVARDVVLEGDGYTAALILGDLYAEDAAKILEQLHMGWIHEIVSVDADAPTTSWTE